MFREQILFSNETRCRRWSHLKIYQFSIYLRLQNISNLTSKTCVHAINSERLKLTVPGISLKQRKKLNYLKIFELFIMPCNFDMVSSRPFKSESICDFASSTRWQSLANVLESSLKIL